MSEMERNHRIFMGVTVTVLAGLLVFAWCGHSRLYTVTVLPQVGGQMVVPCAINDRGQIVGVCQGLFYLWQQGRDWRELGSAADTRDFYCINNAGQIAGTMQDPNGSERAFLWDPNEGLTTLMLPGGHGSAVRGLNNRGKVVGGCWNAAGVGRAFLWSKAGGMEPMDESAWGAAAINDAGQVVGWRKPAAQEPKDGQFCLWEPTGDGTMLETLLPSGALYGINNNGYVLGKTFNFDKKRHYVFLWRQDRHVEWLFPLESQAARVVALNDANQVAVCEEAHSGLLKRLTKRNITPRKESFVWTRENGRISLDGYVLEEKGEYFNITAMSNRGCIVGTVTSKAGDIRRAVLLEPIPERWGR